MPTDNIPAKTEQTRRHFLQWAGAGAAASWVAAGGALGQPPAAAKDQPLSRVGATPRLPLAVASYTFRDFPLEQALAMTARLDVKHICLKSMHLPLDATPEQIAQAAAKVKEAGIDLYGCGVVTMRKEAEVNQAFDYAKAAGMRVIVASPAHEVLPLVNEKVQKYDIRVAIHNHGPGDKLFPTPESVYEKVKGLDKRVGLCMDIGHTLRIGADPVRSAQQYADRLLDVHIKDVSAADKSGKTVEIGRGMIDIPNFLRMLIQINYAGMVAFEHEKDAKDPLPGLAESVGYVRGVLAAL
jgi:sugar phosphate isomerase/epimerase